MTKIMHALIAMWVSAPPDWTEPSILCLIGAALVGLGVLFKCHVRPAAKTADEQLVSVAI